MAALSASGRSLGSARDLDAARQTAEDALAEYARLAFRWNAPDDEYTRLSIRGLAEQVITGHADGTLHA